ncbi:Intradiol ring-cleavage dioxygenase [Leucosporidium creatinivorum]|uniref:Intradiol ring-cleavage dioxygenase n=1 Tax=Leucosporidium creatinivorum TaxID=106004 RepID=A0A1Y2ER97_9BASI|nr:Intradiol ring-cleavage dioxygenase [Leucosporidium creatinivorum]
MSSADLSAYTQSVIAAIGAKASPRVKAAFPILIKHLHAAIVESEFTIEEWLATCELLAEAGKMTTDKRNEMVLVSDVLGIESLCDMLEHARFAKAGVETTSSAILGPFYRTGVPAQPNDTSIVRKKEAGADYTYLHGVVTGSDGKPLKGAIVDVWHDAPDGLYDAQDETKPEYHCRGRFETDDQGRYSTFVLKPTPYPIPFDGPAGNLLQMMDRHPYRPAHIHFYVEAPGHKTLVTQVFSRDSKYLDDDSVFAVKDSLVVDFKPVTSSIPPLGEFDEAPQYELEYNIALAGLKDVDTSKYQG